MTAPPVGAFTAAELAEFVRENRYHHGRLLADGSAACLIPLMTTTAILLGVTPGGWERRFCFADSADALARYIELQSEDDVPFGHIARRGR